MSADEQAVPPKIQDEVISFAYNIILGADGYCVLCEMADPTYNTQIVSGTTQFIVQVHNKFTNACDIA
eukprot:scaffold10268_cov61-Cyclotella_meneghiniana.AAC.1